MAESEPELKEDDIYLLEHSESVFRYNPGGFHHVRIGDVLHHRYRILYKLGYGGYSTSWLARDISTQNLVAVKVGISDTTDTNHAREADTLSTLAAALAAESTLPRNLIPTVLDNFIVQGSNGNHPCYVRAAARGSLLARQDGRPKGIWEQHLARSLAAQLALAVAFIHRQGVVHGDIHPRNVLVQFVPDVNQLSDKQLYQIYGQPTTWPVRRRDDKPLPKSFPSYIIYPVWLAKHNSALKPYPPRIMLADFGESFKPAQEARCESNTPLIYRPPENYFNDKGTALSFPSDIWSLACVLWDTISYAPLFSELAGEPEDLIRDHVKTLGMLPAGWWRKWKTRSEFFNNDGSPVKPMKVLPIEARFEEFVQKLGVKYGRSTPLAQDEKEAFLSLIKAMLAYKPEDRITAKEVLMSEWMVKWALPAFEKSR